MIQLPNDWQNSVRWKCAYTIGTDEQCQQLGGPGLCNPRRSAAWLTERVTHTLAGQTIGLGQRIAPLVKGPGGQVGQASPVWSLPESMKFTQYPVL